MFKSWDLGKFAGISVRIHWSFWLLMLVYSLMAAMSGGLVDAAMTAVTLGLLFACVLAHEFGHAFAAAAFGIPTRDITLLPIGGLARLDRMPDKPIQELVIALAGPAVNVVIALALLLLTPMQSLAELSRNPALILGGHLLENLLVANVALVVFNLLPAFPMDGGRVLRSLLAMRTSHLKATEIAAGIGRWMAVAFVLIGLFGGNLGLCLVGFFVFVAGGGELMAARQRAMPEAQPWVYYRWNGPGPGPGGSWQYSSRPPQSDQSTSPDVIDAVEVKQIFPDPRRIDR